jgi:hypothetical protein
MIDEDFVTYLETQSSITDIVSTRIYPIFPPQNPTYPLLTYAHVDTERDLVFAGQTDFEETDFRLTGWAATQTAAKSIRAAIIDVLKNFQGTMGNTAVKNVVLSGDVEQIEPATMIYLSSILVTIFYEAS